MFSNFFLLALSMTIFSVNVLITEGLLQGTAAVLKHNITTQAWNLMWADEFNGNAVDTKKWEFNIGAGGWGRNELQYYRKENAAVSGGNLIITGKKEIYGGAQYTSARLKTQGKISGTYGKVEMRAKLPTGNGMWPMFFLLGDSITTVGWPACGEIDIMEYIGNQPNKIFTSVHATRFDSTKTYTGAGFATSFKVYSIIWDPSSISFYVDGQSAGVIYKSSSGGHWPFEGNTFYLNIQFAIGGDLARLDSSTVFPQEMKVDYVRWYRGD